MPDEKFTPLDLARRGAALAAERRIEDARDLWVRAVALFERLGDRKHHAEFTRKLADLPIEQP